MNSDWEKLRRFAMQLFPAGYAGRSMQQFLKSVHCQIPPHLCTIQYLFRPLGHYMAATRYCVDVVLVKIQIFINM